ncbi:MAG: formylglycine-generating enzyme family protein, partial [Myxococcales bacterium]|nr:formylglycine-generating enzyme family protein [Myxococcales bacterium]
GCLDQAPGACRDITGIKGTVIEDGGFVRQEKVAVGAFEIMPTEVTQAQYLTLTGKDPSYERCPDCPVTQVSATEAAAFCAAVGGRLPTPDEWERAARGKAAVGRDGELGDVAWYVENSGRRPHEVGTKKANGLGLYDLLGNVWEWVADRPDKGNDWRSYIRGGSWGTDSRMVRPERSLGIAGRLTSDFVGFRCAR